MTNSPNQPRPHALYRFYGHDDALLYVGITVDIGARWPRHADGKPWWHEVARTTVEHHPDQTSALAAEKAAIIAEKPRYNIQHNRGTAAAPANQPPGRLVRGTVRQDDVVALGLWDGDCPVGIITDLDENAVRLDLFHFGDGSFTAGPRVVFWPEIAKVLHAREQDDHELVGGSDWMTVEKAKKVYRSQHVFDTIPLGDFQERWRKAHMPTFTCTSCGQPEGVDRWFHGDQCRACHWSETRR